MFENFDIEVCNIFKKAEKFKKQLDHEYVGTEHLLLAILDSNDPIVEELKKFNLTFNLFYEEVEASLEPSMNSSDIIQYTPLLKRVISSSESENNKVSTRKLLYEMLNIGEGVAIRILIALDIDVDAIYNYLKESPDDLEVYKFGKILNNTIALDEKVVGREKEINIMIETLLRKKKNNPLLVGDAGVGKSAIVEELARKIVLNDVPDELLDCKIVSIDMASVLAGTRYRGEFEERLTKIIEEVKRNNNIILFIDEVHAMVNAGAAEGAIAAADILKPALARGEIKCIGATTKKEYEKTLAKDKALNRRFECILVKEPNEEETFNILKAIKDEYINYHKVNIKDEILKSLIHLAEIYFPERKNPDKSIELLDSVMSYIKLKEKRNTIYNKEQELKKIGIYKVKLLENGNYKDALKTNILENKLKKELCTLKSGRNLFVKEDDIIDVLEYKNNIILSKKKIKIINDKLKESYAKKTLDLISNTLKKKEICPSFMFIGQCNAFIEDLAKSLNYEIYYLQENNIPMLFNKIKYYPSQIIVAPDNASFRIKELLEKITKEHLVEYEDEYYSFNSAIVIINSKQKTLGFDKSYVSMLPYDEIISFEKNVLA